MDGIPTTAGDADCRFIADLVARVRADDRVAACSSTVPTRRVPQMRTPTSTST